MRILIQPLVITRDVTKDSACLAVMNLIEKCLKVRQDLWFYVIFPEDVTGYEEFEKLGHVTVVLERRKLRRFYKEIVSVDVETIFDMFSATTGFYQIDLAVTHKTGIALLLARLLNDERITDEKGLSAIPVLVLEDRAWGRTDTHEFVDGYEFALRAESYSMLPSIIYNEHEKNDAVDASRNFLSDEMYRRMKKNIRIKCIGIPVDKVDEAIKRAKKRERFTMFYGGRFSYQKRTPFVLELMLKVIESGRDADMLLTFPNPFNRKIALVLKKYYKRNKRMEVYSDVGRLDFLTYCASSHVAIAAGLYEGFPVGTMEMLATGVPTLVPDRVWSRDLIGSDYKLLYSTFSDAYSKLCWVYDNYEEAKKIGEETRETVIRKYDSLDFAKEFLKIAEEVVTENDKRITLPLGDTSYGTADAIVESFGGQRFTMIEFMRKFSNLSITGKKVDFEVGFKKPTLWALRKYLLSRGVRDLCDGGVPTFE